MNEIKDVPYIVHESDMARQERTIKRLWVICIMLLLALLITNACWIYYESQWMEVGSTELMQDINAVADGNGNVNLDSVGNYYEQSNN